MRFAPVLLCAGLLAAQAPPAPQDLCRVEGTAVNSVTGQPVPRASVTLENADASGEGEPARAATDSEGRFAFTAIAAGRYQLSAQHDNFQYIPPRRNGLLTLIAGDRRTDLVVRLAPLGAIAGHVRNEEGDPLENIAVSVLSYRYTSSGRQLSPVPIRQAPGPITDDQGAYRVHGLPPGKYFIWAVIAGQRPGIPPDERYASSYYPSATDDSGAAPLDLAAGQELRNIDIVLRRFHVASVRGRVTNPPAAPVDVVAENDISNPGSRADSQGRFEIRDLLPGPYSLTARATAGGKQYTAMRPIQLGPDGLEGIELTLLPPVSLDGVVRIEGNSGIKPSELHFAVAGREVRRGGTVNDDWTFSVADLPPAVYHLSLFAPGNTYQKSLRCGNTEVTVSGIDLTSGAGCDLTVTLSANGGRIEGQIVDEDGQPAPSAVVTLADSSAPTRVIGDPDIGLDGHFRAEGLAPGTYRVYAWESVDQNQFQYDPEFTKPYESYGQTVEIGEGGRKTVTLRLIPASSGQ
jgi:hypothetical protein